MHIPDKTRLREFLRIKKYLVLALVGKPDRKKEHVKNRFSVENQTCEGRKEKNYEHRQESKKLQTWTRNVGRGRQVGGRADHPTVGRNGSQQAGSGME